MNAFDIWLFSHINANTTTSIWLLEAARSITVHLPTLALVGLTPMIFMESRYRRILFGVIIPGGHPKCSTNGHPNCSTLATVI